MNVTNQPHEPTEIRTAKPGAPVGKGSPEVDHPVEVQPAPNDTPQEHAEEATRREAGRAWRALQKRPSLGVLLFGGLAVMAADAIGVGELAIGIAAGYAAYQALRKDRNRPRPRGEAHAQG